LFLRTEEDQGLRHADGLAEGRKIGSVGDGQLDILSDSVLGGSNEGGVFFVAIAQGCLGITYTRFDVIFGAG